jgi:hypothetical protein
VLAISSDARPDFWFCSPHLVFINIGLDPPGFKLRAASGFEAADFFVAGTFAGLHLS